MSPHILLKDMASTQSLDDSVPSSNTNQGGITMGNSSADGGLESYVETLLQSSRTNGEGGLLSPTEPPTPGTFSGYHSQAAPMKEIIDSAIVHGVATRESKASANRFQISRGGDKVATVLLFRSAYRLGEVVQISVDLQNADVVCSALVIDLETSEVVDPTIALRSSASIYRATRRVHAQRYENTLCARRSAFGLTIPMSATPNFITTGVRLEWKLRFEFVTADRDEELIEKLTKDDRGTVSSAAQELSCQSFEVYIPLHVYGSNAGPDDDATTGTFAV